MFPRRSLVLALVLLVLVASGCGGNENPSGSVPESSSAPAGAGLQHIHGLGISDGALVIATHTGLWAAPQGQTKARRLGSSKQDIMGFSVLGRHRFIGSGHPDPSQRQPPNLGLIESRDGGRSWKNVSLFGDADFHVLQSSGSRVYGFDGTQGRLMVSSDRGRSWGQRTSPAAMFSLAIDPSRADRVVTSTERGMFASRNAGKTFRALARHGQLAGLLAWPAAGRLFIVDGGGRVLRSRDGGDKWLPVGAIGGPPAAFMAHGDDLYAALADGTVKRSPDGGKSWVARAIP